MLTKTLAATAIGIGSLAAIAAPASADEGPGVTHQVGIINVDDSLNNVCLLPWNDGNVLAVPVPLVSPNDYQACNEGKSAAG